MKKIMSFQIIFLLSLFLFSSFNFPSDSFSEANTCATMEEEAAVSLIRICQIKEVDEFIPGCPQGNWQLSVDDGCNSRISGKIFATNLAPAGIDPIIGNTYSLPANCPPMYVRSSYDGSISSPINNLFIYHGETHIGTDGNLYHLFTYNASVSLNILGDCETDGFANVKLSVSLIDGFGRLYPVDDYALPYQAFSCKVFSETCHECGSSSCGPTDPDPVYDGIACGECDYEDCGNDNNQLLPSSNSTLTSNQVEEKIATEVDQIFTISPNPFSESFMINNLVQDKTAIEIEIYDANGKRVYHIPTKTIEGNQSVEISSSDFASGVYYCKIKTAAESITKKIIKIK